MMTLTSATKNTKNATKAAVSVAMDAVLACDTGSMLALEREIGRGSFAKPTLGRVARELVRQGRIAEAVLVLTIRVTVADALAFLAPALTVAVGDIFVASWGYDQTNLDWYEVVEVSASGGTATLREIGATRVGGGTGYNHVAPRAGQYIGEAFKARVGKGYRGQAYINDPHDHHAYAWDGFAKHETASGYGH